MAATNNGAPVQYLDASGIPVSLMPIVDVLRPLRVVKADETTAWLEGAVAEARRSAMLGESGLPGDPGKNKTSLFVEVRGRHVHVYRSPGSESVRVRIGSTREEKAAQRTRWANEWAHEAALREAQSEKERKAIEQYEARRKTVDGQREEMLFLFDMLHRGVQQLGLPREGVAPFHMPEAARTDIEAKLCALRVSLERVPLLRAGRPALTLATSASGSRA